MFNLDAKRAKEIEEEEARRQEAARDQADAGSPHETGKFSLLFHMIKIPERILSKNRRK